MTTPEPTSSTILKELDQAIARFSSFDQAIAGITVQERFKTLVLNACGPFEVFGMRVLSSPALSDFYSGVPLYWVSRQPEEVRIYNDQKSLEDWLHFQDTGELNVISGEDWGAAQVVGEYLFNRHQFIEPVFPQSEINRQFGLFQTPDDYPILERATAVNGYAVSMAERYSFTAKVNVAIALAMAKQRGWKPAP